MRSLLLATALVAVALVTSCAGSAPPDTVEMVPGRMFSPARLEVEPGDTVTFRNAADDSHTVTAEEDSIPAGGAYFASGGFNSEGAANDNVADGLLTNRQSFEVSFTAPGTYRYYCIPHRSDGMTGEIVVAEP